MIYWGYVALTVLLTVYGQLIVKWQVSQAGTLPADLGQKVSFLLGVATTPWMFTVYLAALVAAISWMAAMTHLELSKAYPFVGSSFILVLLASAVFFDERLSAPKVLGTCLIFVGLAVVSRA